MSARAGSALSILALAAALGVPMANAAYAEDTNTASANSDPDFFTGLFASSRSNLLGDMGGIRSSIANYGFTFGWTETSEVLGNLTGGTRQGFEYDGNAVLSLQLDTSKKLGIDGGTFNVSALQIHGRDLSADNLSDLQTASGIEANRATRLWELWYDQQFGEGGPDIKIGQQSIDQEFIASQASALYVNTMMGWPMLPSADLYGGGPAYPLSSLGVRGKADVGSGFTALGGVFDDNPPGGTFAGASQLRGAEKSGTEFNLKTGALFIGEIQYALNQPAVGDMAKTEDKAGLPGTYKLGFWYDTAAFPDQRYDTNGVSLAAPTTNGVARSDRGNFSVYGVADQTVWQPDPNDPQAVAVFARAMGAPGDRNLIDFSLDAGINLKAPLPGRDNDTFGVGYGLAHISSGASGFDSDTNRFGGGPVPVRSAEQFVEVTYQYQAAPWWQIQPDMQYVFNPGGGINDPVDLAHRLQDEWIVGVRTNITF